MYQASAKDDEKDGKDSDDKKDSGDKKAHITTQIKSNSKKIRIILLVINFTIIQKIMITKSNST